MPAFHPRSSVLSLAGALALAASAPLNAQLPTVVLRAGEPIGGLPALDMTGLDWIASNHAGGLVVSLDAASSTVVREFLWGSFGGGTPGPLLGDGPLGGVNVLHFERAAGGSGSALVHLPDLGGIGGALMVDDTVLATAGGPGAPGGATWFSFDEPFLDLAGRAWVRARFSGASNGRGLFRRAAAGSALEPIFRSGDTLVGLPGSVDPAGAPHAGYDVASSGAHWIGVVRSTTFLDAVVKDGAVLAAGGVPLVTQNLLPPAFQAAPNERYNWFSEVQVTHGDRWAVIAGTPSELILRDGGLFARTGHVVDGWTLVGGFRGIALDREGRLAWIARVEVSPGVQRYAVFRETTLLYKEGDTVDVDGDGSADPGYAIFDITGSAGRLAYTDEGTIWANVRVTTPLGGTPVCLLAFADPIGTAYCPSVPNSSGLGARILALGSASVAADAMRLRCVDMPAQAFGYFLCSRTQGFVAGAGGSQGNLCLSGAIGRFVAQPMNAGAARAIEIGLDLGALPQPVGTVAAIAGEVWSFQCWFRDANPTITSNFSNGVEVTMQ